MSTDAIYQKYMQVVQQVTGDGTWVDWGVVRLALRLAIDDAYNGAPFTDLHALLADRERALQNALDHIDALRRERNAQPDQRYHEHLQAQINRLNEWLAEHEQGLYECPGDTTDAILSAIARRDQRVAEYNTALAGAQNEANALREQLAQMDADNAGLTRRCTGLEAVLSDVMQQRDAAQQEIDRLTHQNVIAVDAFNSLREPATATNGNGASPAADSPLSSNTWYQHLDAETDDWRVSIEAGRRTFRQVPKAQRLLLAQAVAKYVGGGKLPRQADFDLGKPDWMPGGGGLATAFGCTWSELLTVTPFEVAP